MRVAAMTYQGIMGPWVEAKGTPAPGSSEFLSADVKKPGKVRKLKMEHDGEGSFTVSWRHPKNKTKRGRAPERYMIHFHHLSKHSFTAPIRKTVLANEKQVTFTGIETSGVPQVYGVEVWAVSYAGKGKRAYVGGLLTGRRITDNAAPTKTARSRQA